MKKTILTTLLAVVVLNANAQVITDTVSVGASYTNQVWYSLSNDEQGAAPKNNWDMAFDVSGFGSTIMINSVVGTTLWKYPKSDTSGWNTIDTAGLSSWPARWNSDTSWALGAMGNYADPSNPYDLDWGLYNVTTHVVTGDSLYVIKLADGTYRKLWIQSLAGSIYNFKYADLSGTNPHNATLDKSLYAGKKSGYYSLQTNAALNREPASANWDIVFTQYTTFIPAAYTVTGVLSNTGVKVAKLANLNDLSTNTNWATATFHTEINTIGYNWKAFTGTAYHVQDSLLYFVQPVNGDIWKVIFTGFGGSGDGNYIFTKEKLHTATNVSDMDHANAMSMALYPNPSTGKTINVIYSFKSAVSSAVITISDILGKTVVAAHADTQPGLHQYLVPVQTLQPGMYMVNVKSEAGSMQQKLIIQ